MTLAPEAAQPRVTPSVRAAHAYSDGVPYFECQVVNMAKDGYLLIGLGGPDMGDCNTHIPDECFDHYRRGLQRRSVRCVAPRARRPRLTRAQVCAWAAGQGESAALRRGRPRGLLDQLCPHSGTQPTDSLSLSLLSRPALFAPYSCPRLTQPQVTFYLNDKPIVEFSDLPQHEDFWASCVFGAPGYLVSINPVPRLPLGITRWSEDAVQPYRCVRRPHSHIRAGTKLMRCCCRYDLMHDDFTVVSLSHATAIAVAQCCVEYETGVPLQAAPSPRLPAVFSPDDLHAARLSSTPWSSIRPCILGVALTSCGKSLQLVPDPEHLHMGLSSDGDVYVFGQKVKSGIVRLRDGDAVGILLDLTGEACTLYRNGNPVYRVEDRRIRGQFSVTLCALGRFKCSLLPTPVPRKQLLNGLPRTARKTLKSAVTA